MSNRKTAVVLAVSLVTLVAVPLFWYGRGGGEQPSSSSQPVQTTQPVRTTQPRQATPSVTASASVRTRAADLPAVAAEALPVELTVGKAQLRMPVVPTGVAADGQMELPPNPARIGWYRFGPGPTSTTGSVVLGGHLDSRQYGAGPLARLSRTKPGDPIELRLSDGRTLQYRTEAVRDVDKQTLALAVVFDRSGPRRLQIVTCGGEYLPERGGYQENLVVTAIPVE